MDNQNNNYIPDDELYSVEVCENTEEGIKAKLSPYGNYAFYITEEQLEQLKNGKIIYCDIGSEYGAFIKFKK